MFYELSSTTKSSKLLEELRLHAPKEAVVAFVPNDLYATTHRDYEPWIFAAITNSGRVLVESSAAAAESLSPFRGVNLGIPAPCPTDAFQFPCRNALETLHAHNIVNASTTSGLDLADTFHWIHNATSVWSGPALIHQKHVFRMRNASHLPTIASIVESKRDKRRFLMVLTPYNPMFETSKSDLQDAQRKIGAYLDPVASQMLPVDDQRMPNSGRKSSSVAMQRAPLINRHAQDPERRTFDPVPDDIFTAIHDVEDSEASSFIDAKMRPDGIAYTMSLCQIAQASCMSVVTHDGTLIMSLQPTDLAPSSDGRLKLPLVVRPASTLEVVSLGVGSLQVDGRSQTSNHFDAPTLCWAGAVPCHPRMEWVPASSVAFTVAALFSDGAVKVYALCGSNISGDACDDVETSPPIFSPAEASSPSRLCGLNNESRELFVHCCGVTHTNPQHATRSPTAETATSRQSTSFASNSCSARLSPCGGLLAFLPAGCGSDVVVCPLGHALLAARVHICEVGFTDQSTEALTSIVWLPSSLSHATSGLLALSTKGRVWWCCASSDMSSPVCHRDFALDPRPNQFEWDQTPTYTPHRRKAGIVGAIQDLFGRNSADAIVSLTSSVVVPSVLIAFPIGATARIPGIGAEVLLLLDKASSERENPSTPRILAKFCCSRAPTAETILESALRSITRDPLQAPQLLERIVGLLFFGSPRFDVIWGMFLAHLPKDNLALMSRLGVAVTDAYIRTVAGALMLPGRVTRLRMRPSQNHGNLPSSLCAKDVMSLKHHVHFIMAAHGCVSALGDCASHIGSSVFSGTVEAAHIVDVAMCLMLADRRHIRVFSAASSSVSGESLWQSLTSSCSPEAKAIFAAASEIDRIKAQHGKVEERERQDASAISAPPSSSSASFDSFVEVERAALECVGAVGSLSSPPSSQTHSAWTKQTIVKHFSPVLDILLAELDSFVAYLLLTRPVADAIAWIQTFLNSAECIKDHHASLEPAITKLSRIIAGGMQKS